MGRGRLTGAPAARASHLGAPLACALAPSPRPPPLACLSGPLPFPSSSVLWQRGARVPTSLSMPPRRNKNIIGYKGKRGANSISQATPRATPQVSCAIIRSSLNSSLLNTTTITTVSRPFSRPHLSLPRPFGLPSYSSLVLLLPGGSGRELRRRERGSENLKLPFYYCTTSVFFNLYSSNS